MQSRLIRQIAFFLAVVFVVGLFLVDASAQSRRRRRTRRVKRPVITNPAIYEPATATRTTSDATATPEDKIISTADENPAEADTAAQKVKTGAKPGSDEELQQTINKLANRVEVLTDQVNQKEQKDRDQVDTDRLTKAEQRAEALRAQLVDVESKLADLQARLDQVEYGLRPENIERATQGAGTVHPEDARDTRRRQLENERARTQAQIKILEGSRERLEPSIAFADSEVDSLRVKIQQQREQERLQPPPTEPPASRTRKKP
jgi:chromosome segregation ATPase